MRSGAREEEKTETGFSEEEGRSETDGAVAGGRRRGREKNEEEEGWRGRASDEREGSGS